MTDHRPHSSQANDGCLYLVVAIGYLIVYVLGLLLLIATLVMLVWMVLASRAYEFN